MKNLHLLFFCSLFFSSFLTAQNGFNYQAVVRDPGGMILPDILIGFRIGIVQNDINASPIYQETHLVSTNEFGVVTFLIGEGNPTLGNFSSIDWSKLSFTKVELDIAGGNNYVQMGTTQLGTVPRALYAERTGSLFGLDVRNFGAVGNDVTDDSGAIQTAINAAATNGNRVIFPAGNYKTTSTLIIPDGVMLIGEGVGSNPLSGPYNGSAIRYVGSESAIIVQGHTAGIRDMAIIDRSQGNATEGVHIVADGRLVESIRFFNVLIFGFTNGTSLKLEAKNAGGIAYCSFYNVRIRNTKIGIHLLQDASSFANSNTWFHGAVSGGGFDYCLKVDGGNNNQFYGTIFEPFTSTFGHIVVTQGEIQANNIRIEGNSQNTTTPLVEFQSGTYNSYLSGTYAGGLTLDRGNNTIDLRSGKTVKFINSNNNQFENASFLGFDGTRIPGWEITGNPVIEIETSDLSPHHKVLKLTTSGLTTLKPDAVSMPPIGNAGYFGQLNFGMYVKSNSSNTVALTNNAPSGVITSQYHSGDGSWQFVGMNSQVTPGISIQPKLIITSATTVYITLPALSFGTQIPDLSPKPLTSAGGQIHGVLSTGFVTAPATPANGYLVLNKEGNVFEINGTQTIHRINHSGADRFLKGTIVTLLFNDAGCSLTNGAYLNLKSGYTSIVNGSIELISLGNGVWREMGRNE